MRLFIQNPIQIGDIAGHIGVSEERFCRLFKKISGEHFIDYLNRVRIRHAAIALLETVEPVSGIAYSCGFNTFNHFTTVFRKLRGKTPGKYRRSGF